MKTYQILLLDTITKELTKVEKIYVNAGRGGHINIIKEKLRALQSGYCINEKPKIEEVVIKNNGIKIQTIRAFCSSDYEYLCLIKKI